MSDGFDIPINTDDAAKALTALLKRLDTFGSKADKVLAGFEKDADKSFKSVSGSAKGLEKSVGSIASTLKGFGALAIGALGIGAIKGLGGALEDAVKSASEKETALKGVESALQRTGQFSRDALKEVSAFADRLEDTTGLADDTALKMFTLANSFTKNKDQAMKLVTAANDLSVATGKSLESSVTALGKSLTGTLGPLDEFDPSLKRLSKAALEAGGAIDSVLRTMGGAAAAQMMTFQGATLGVANKMDDLKVAIGELITKNPVIIDLVKTFGSVLGDLASIISENQDGIRSFMKDGIIFMLEGMSALVPVVGLVVDAIGAIGKISLTVEESVLRVASAITSFGPASEAVKLVIGYFAKFAEIMIQVQEMLLKAPESLLSFAGVDISGLGEALQGMRITVGEINTSIQNSNLSEKFAGAATAVSSFRDAHQAAFQTITNGLNSTQTAVDGYIAKLKTIPASVETKATVGVTGMAGPNGKTMAPGNGLPDTVELERTLGAALLRNLETAAATIGTGFLAGIQQGGEGGARKAVGSAASGIASLAGAAGPVAGAIGSAIEILGQDPAAFKQMIQGFVDGIPVIIDNIVENIPVLVETLANNLGPIITSLISAIPRITIAVIKSIPVVIRSIVSQITGGLSYQLGNVGGNFSANINKGIDQMLGKLTSGGTKIKEMFTNLITNQINFQKKLAEKQLEFAKKIGEFVKQQIQKNIEFARRIVNAGRDFALKIFEVFKRIKSSIDGLIQRIKDALSIDTGSVGESIGLSKGGLVKPLYAAAGAFVPRGTDTVPAMLTPGELVIPRDMVQQLTGQGGGSDVSEAALALLAQAVALLSQPMQVSTELKWKGKGLADILVDFDRRGVRTTA